MDVQTSKTKRTFADLQEKVLHDATAGSTTNRLQIYGASLAGKIKSGRCYSPADLLKEHDTLWQWPQGSSMTYDRLAVALCFSHFKSSLAAKLGSFSAIS